MLQVKKSIGNCLWYKLKFDKHVENILLIQFTVCLMVVNLHRIWDPKFGNKHPLKLKILTPLLVLKKKLESREWKPVNCPCRICKVYIPNLGFIWSLFGNSFWWRLVSYRDHSQLIYKSNQFTGLYVVRDFTDGS